MARRRTGPDPKEAALAGARCLNPHPGQVTDPAFLAEEFSGARDAAQVKYDMVRRVTVDGEPVTATAAFGYSQPAYLPGSRCPGEVRTGRAGVGQARTPRRPQAHRRDPRLGREAAGGPSRPLARRPGRSHRHHLKRLPVADPVGILIGVANRRDFAQHIAAPGRGDR